MENIKKIPWDLLTKHVAGESSEEEKQKVEAWISKDETNRKILDELSQSWFLNDERVKVFNPDKQKAWKNVSDRIKDSKTGFEKFRFYTIRVAAMILITFAIYYFGSNEEVKYITITEAAKSFYLPDGSEIMLNENSNLKYPEEFSENKREVSLNGEGFFTVQKDASKPFIVNSSNTKIEVLGTSFNYSARKDENEDQVIVVSGKVAFSEKQNPENKIILEKGSSAKFDKQLGELTFGGKFDSNKFAWRTGILRFENDTMESVSNVIKKHFGVEVVLPDSFKDIKITATFNNEKLKNILPVLEMILGAKFKQEENKIIIEQ